MKTQTTPRYLLLFVAALAALSTAPPALRADPIVSTSQWSDFVTSTVLNYDGVGASLEVIPPGSPNVRAAGPNTLRYLFSPGEIGGTSNPQGIYQIGVKAYAFNTDLALNSSQFSLPPGWTATPNGLVPGLGRFSWVLSTPTITAFGSKYAGFDITGLPSTVRASDFVLPAAPDGANASRAWFAADIVPNYDPNSYSGNVPTVTDFWASSNLQNTPEPSTLLLVSVGLTACVAARVAPSSRRSESQ